MLEKCAGEFRIEAKQHRQWVHCKGLTFRNLPLGGHGHRRNPEIQIGHIRQMIRLCGIDEDCARSILPALG